MFKKYAVQMNLVKKNADTDVDSPAPAYADPEQMKVIATEFVKDTAKVVVISAAAIFAANLICTVALKIVESTLEN